MKLPHHSYFYQGRLTNTVWTQNTHTRLEVQTKVDIFEQNALFHITKRDIVGLKNGERQLRRL